MRSIHFHFVTDKRWRVLLSGVPKKSGKRIEFTATVEAPDHYEAGDKVKALAEKKFGELYGVVMKFGSVRLPGESLSAIVAGAAEE